MGVDKFNHEGYFDPTTYEALTNIQNDTADSLLMKMLSR